MNDEQCFLGRRCENGTCVIHVSIMLIVLVVSDAMTVVNVSSLVVVRVMRVVARAGFVRMRSAWRIAWGPGAPAN